MLPIESSAFGVSPTLTVWSLALGSFLSASGVGVTNVFSRSETSVILLSISACVLGLISISVLMSSNPVKTLLRLSSSHLGSFAFFSTSSILALNSEEL